MNCCCCSYPWSLPTNNPCPGSLGTFTAFRLTTLSSAQSRRTLQWTKWSALATKSTSGDAHMRPRMIVEATRVQGWFAQMVSISFQSPLSAKWLSEPPMMTTGDQGSGSGSGIPGKLWNLIQKFPSQRNQYWIFLNKIFQLFYFELNLSKDSTFEL